MSEPCPTEPHGSLASGPSRYVTPPPGTSPLLVSSLPNIPCQVLQSPANHLLTGKWDHSPSGSPDYPQTKETQVTSPKVKVGSEHSSTWGNNHMPNLTPETRTGSGQQRQESSSPSSSPIRGPADPDDKAVTGSSKSTRDQTSSDSGSSRGNMADSDLDTASRVASLVQILMRYLYGLLIRNIEKE